MNFKSQETETKLRGGYYTPEKIAQFLAKWVITTRPDSILEPSCGDGSFIKALDGQLDYSIDFTGVELIEEEAEKARVSANDQELLNSDIINIDFLEWALSQLDLGTTYDGVLGNPPYIRYQYLDPEDQDYSARIFARYDLAFTKHTNAWVPFVIASIGLLAPGGRLAMVIPSELLHVLHAGSLRRFLLTTCQRILMIDPTELLFEAALQGTVLLMVEKKFGVDQISEGVGIISAPNNDFLNHNPEDFFQNANYIAGNILNGKWMKVFLDQNEIEVFERVQTFNTIRKFDDIATVDVGIVTGANKFFLVNHEIVNRYALHEFAQPMFGRSDHCPGIIYNQETHESNQTNGLPSYFINFGTRPLETLPDLAREYLLFGEEQGLHTRYKCRIRKPWYAVPSIYATSIGMLKRSHNYPRLILNEIEAYTTDTAYRIRTKTNEIPAKLLVYSFINSLTALTAELEGRHYGGGVLELVPSEIEKLLVPIPQLPEFDINNLDQQIRHNMDVDSLLREQDEVILVGAGLTMEESLIIHNAWSRIRNRRQRLIGDIDTNND